MSKDDLKGDMTPETIGTKERKLIDQFLELRQSYQAITRQIEHDLQTPLDHYQQKRLFFRYSRLLFTRVIGNNLSS